MPLKSWLQSHYPVMGSIEITKSSPLRGTPPLQGDALLACHALFLSAMARGRSRLENIPESRLVEDLMELFNRLGYRFVRENGLVSLDGKGQRPGELDEPVFPGHEMVLMALGGLFAGSKSPNLVGIDSKAIPKTSTDVFLKLFDCALEKNRGNEEKGPVYRVLAIRQSCVTDPKEEYLARTARLFYHLSCGTGARIKCGNSGPDHLEKLLALVGPGVELHKSVQKEMSDLEKRMARKLKQTERTEQHLILPDSMSLKDLSLSLPNDISLASIYVLAATLVPDSEIILENVLLNPSRTGFISALRRMGAVLELSHKRELCGETLGTVKVNYSELKGRKFDFEALKNMREEIPLLIIAGAYAAGETVIRDIAFLRYYEQDLLKRIILSLKEAKVEIGEIEDGLVIRGKSEYDGHTFSSFGNAILGFAFFIMGLRSYGTSAVAEAECMEELFPGTIENLRKLAVP
ncbi:hypothetical protein ACFL5V_07490 [Fibrobacterota bacterium]